MVGEGACPQRPLPQKTTWQSPNTPGPSHLFTFAQDAALPMNVSCFSAQKGSSHQPHPRCASSCLTWDVHVVRSSGSRVTPPAFSLSPTTNQLK